ncbi:Oxysterol-binding protein-domain-containing protein [Entophlyctis helioformis]|nr:Oxysterol-binding protein-domain-containing protein [Entophlyctis helioformis]
MELTQTSRTSVARSRGSCARKTESRSDSRMVTMPRLLRFLSIDSLLTLPCVLPALAQAPIQSLNLTAQAVAPNVLAPQGVHRGPQEAPVLKGMLFKWTNYTSGYKSRYFVLENGSLSYYHDATDYPHSCRGSISTIAANVTMPDANDNSRFDIVASGNVKYSIKARSPADAKKWVWYLMESKRFMTDLRKAQMAGSLGNASLPTAASYPTTVSPRTSGTSLAAFGALAATAGSAASSTMALSTSGMALASHAAGGVAPIPAALSAPALAADKFWDPADGNDDDDDDDLQDATDDEPPVEDPLLSKVSSALSLLKLKSSDSASASTRPSTTNALPAPNGSRTSAGNRQSLSAMANAATFGPTETELTAGAASASDADAPPQRRSILLNADHVPILETMRAKSRTNVHTLLYLLDVQLEVQERVVQTLVDNLSALPPSPNAAQTTADPEYHSSLVQLPLLLQDSVQHIQQTAKRIVRLYDSREKMWGKRLHREVESRKRWEEVVSCVVGIENTAPFAAPDIRTDADEHGSSTQQRASTSESSAMYATPQPAGNASTPTWPNHSAKPYVRPTEASRKGTLESPSASSFGGDSAGNSAHAHQSSFDDMDDIPDQGDDDDGEDDVFYDAHDGQTTESFIETVLGLSSMDQPRPMPTSLDLVHSPTSPVLDSSNFPSMDSLVASFSGYDPIGKARRSLPLDPSKPKPTLAVWSFLKSAIGKDISKVTLPVFFNEPLSMLQRMCEDIEYIELLSLAGRIGSKSGHPSTSASDPTDIHNDPAALAASCLQLDLNHAEGLAGEDASLLRLMLVGAFAMSNYSSTVGRSNKPFNPMLGETFELVRKDKRFRYISEQVCHHPPISACYCDSPDYTLWTEVYVKSKFWGRSLELQPLGTCHVSLPVFARDPKSGAAIVADSEHYSWKKVTTCVNNIIVGKLSIDHNGDMVIRNWRTGEECVITFKLKESGGWFGGGGSSSSRDDGGGGELVGQVKDATGRVRFELKGRWDDQLMAIPVSPPPSAMLQRPFLLWKRTPTPGNAAQNFNFTEFAMTLNEINPQLRSLLPLTDSRLRPDQTAMERGEWDLATKSKEKLELYQRNKRKEIVAHYNATGISNGPKRDVAAIDIGEAWWTPRWFVREIEPDTMEEHWRFTDEYWTLRQRAAVTNTWPEYVSDVFGLTDPDME